MCSKMLEPQFSKLGLGQGQHWVQRTGNWPSQAGIHRAGVPGGQVPMATLRQEYLSQDQLQGMWVTVGWLVLLL